MDLGSLKEHSTEIAVATSLAFGWLFKRTIGKHDGELEEIHDKQGKDHERIEKLEAKQGITEAVQKMCPYCNRRRQEVENAENLPGS